MNCYCLNIRCFDATDGSQYDRVQKRWKDFQYRKPRSDRGRSGYEILEEYDCTKCKHKIACLVHSEYTERFEAIK